VVVAHTDFTKVTRVVFIEVGSESEIESVRRKVTNNKKIADVPVVVLTTSKTTTSRMFAVLAYSSMTGRNMASVFSCL
jgi:hypothetical protein